LNQLLRPLLDLLMTYDQGKEMARHTELADKLKIKVYFW